MTVNKIIEIWNKALHVYHGNYEKYLQQKAERRAQLESAYRNQREHIDHLEAFISRFRYQATKAKQVQSRIKELDKIERIEIPLEEPAPHFSFPQPPPSGRTVVDVAGLFMQYGEKRVLENVSFTIDRGDRIALVGVNGAGKSTLIRLLSGQETPTTGTLKLGHNVVAEYFAQDQYKVLDPAARMLDDMGRSCAESCGEGSAQFARLFSVLRRRRFQAAGRALGRGAQSLCPGADSGEPGEFPAAR